MSIIRRFLRRIGLLKVRASVLVLGLANSGKTTLVNCLLKECDDEVVPTVGFNMEKLRVGRCDLTVIDMSGQEKYQPLWEMQYTGSKAILFIVDAADQTSLPQAKASLQAVTDHEETQGLPLLVFANKMDLQQASQPPDIAEQLELTKLKQRAFYITGCSALKSEGVEDGIKWLTRQLEEL